MFCRFRREIALGGELPPCKSGETEQKYVPESWLNEVFRYFQPESIEEDEFSTVIMRKNGECRIVMSIDLEF